MNKQVSGDRGTGYAADLSERANACLNRRDYRTLAHFDNYHALASPVYLSLVRVIELCMRCLLLLLVLKVELWCG